MASTTETAEEKETKPRHLTLVEKRSQETSVPIATKMLELIAYQHTMLCQTCMPYRNPGDDVRVWERKQGSIILHIKAGYAIDHSTELYTKLSLPFDPKARLILAHLNREAPRTGSPEIEVERA